ncbi:hypothetical protein ANN_03576 [Periplaneta americana]|uniref:Uncharacterized protein n=1 Tax=Periplaneta americana TaxID=6978 RepID=A0ABQ8U3N6_PERAM|nr:hypothetical protein ANN_03576 [Periplaneta americana]
MIRENTGILLQESKEIEILSRRSPDHDSSDDDDDDEDDADGDDDNDDRPDDMQQRIRQAFVYIQPATCRAVIRSFGERLRMCINVNGHHLEHLV